MSGISQSGAADSSSNFMGHGQSQSMVDGILYNARQQKAQARAVEKTKDIETASVSTFASFASLIKDKESKESKRFWKN